MYTLDFTRPIYIHQINRLRNGRIDELFQAVERECLPLYESHGLQLFGYWECAPGQGFTPETVEIWELKSFEDYQKFVAASHSEKGDPRLRKWAERRSEWIERSENVICLSHNASPTV